MSTHAAQADLETRAALVMHPRRGRALSRTDGALPGLGRLAGHLETRGDGRDADRVQELALSCQPEVVVAAGGDGTVSTVARGLLAVPEARRPELAILPLGTANNVARSHGLLSVRTHGRRAVELAVTAARSGARVDLDVGRANEHAFVGSFALGIDAAILARRNALRDRLRLGEAVGGYPLYLASCALEALLHRGVGATLETDGTSQHRTLYNLLLTTCSIYAGEFRFAGEAPSDVGAIQAHWFESAAGYLPAYVAAWRRHRRHQAGRPIRPAAETRVWRRARLRVDAPVAGQIDGEEIPPARDWTIEVRPGALRLRVPDPGASRPTSPRSDPGASRPTSPRSGRSAPRPRSGTSPRPNPVAP